MAIQEARVPQCTQHTHILALANQQFLHLNIELRQFYALLTDKAGLEALKCDIVYGLIRNGKGKRYFLDAYPHLLYRQALEIFFAVYSGSQMALFMFLEGDDEEEDIFLIVFMM